MAGISEDKLELLRRVPLFATLAADHLAAIAEAAEPVHFSPGETVFREGEYSNSCYVVSSGHASAAREHPAGRAITLARFGPGDVFGELAMLDDERRSATVQALDELDAIKIPGGVMRRLLRERPEIAVRMVVSLGQKLRQTNERL